MDYGAGREFLVPKMKSLVIYSGGFHPFHLGHKSVYDSLIQKFPDADIYVAATDSKIERPFSFAAKKELAIQAGVPEDKFVEVKSPYVALEITKNYDQKKTSLIFVLSEKDKDRIQYTKKDGTPGFFQPYVEDTPMKSFSKHGYIYIAPVTEFKILGQTIDSASKIRGMYKKASQEDKSLIIKELYPKGDPKIIKPILDDVLKESFKIFCEKHYLDYDDWGWIDNTGKLITPSDTDKAHANIYGRHLYLLRRATAANLDGKIDAEEDAMILGWVRWLVVNEMLNFDARDLSNLPSKTLTTIKKILDKHPFLPHGYRFEYRTAGDRTNEIVNDDADKFLLKLKLAKKGSLSETKNRNIINRLRNNKMKSYKQLTEELSFSEVDVIGNVVGNLDAIKNAQYPTKEEGIADILETVGELGLTFDIEEILGMLDSDNDIEFQLEIVDEKDGAVISVFDNDSVEKKIEGDMFLKIKMTDEDGEYNFDPEILVYFDDDEATKLTDIEFETNVDESEDLSEADEVEAEETPDEAEPESEEPVEEAPEEDTSDDHIRSAVQARFKEAGIDDEDKINSAVTYISSVIDELIAQPEEGIDSPDSAVDPETPQPKEEPNIDIYEEFSTGEWSLWNVILNMPSKKYFTSRIVSAKNEKDWTVLHKSLEKDYPGYLIHSIYPVQIYS